ncbi:MAG: 30S ribosomal protein S6, partial [Actinotignum schaalii]|nr:30S ribosomal protein S6 [Actinotignum schaalii]
MREYEMMIILSPNVDERNLSTIVLFMLQVVPYEGGELEMVDFWGRRMLAYVIYM